MIRCSLLAKVRAKDNAHKKRKKKLKQLLYVIRVHQQQTKNNICEFAFDSDMFAFIDC